MTSFFKTSAAALGFLAGSFAFAQAADMPTPKTPAVPAIPAPLAFDIAFGGRVVSDYNFRGISQTDRTPGVQGYLELQLMNNLFYAGIAGYSVDLPTKPTAEVDLTAGIRPKFGPFTFDFGVIRYVYPSERQYIDNLGIIWTPKGTDYTELAGKVAYTWQDKLTLGANVFYAWDWLGTGANGTYTSVTAKYNLPENFAVSGELGGYFLGTTDAYLGGVNLPDYLYWNTGISYTYKAATLDLRYHDTNLSKSKCFLVTTDTRGISTGSGTSKWCNQAFIATLSFDLTASGLGIFDTK